MKTLKEFITEYNISEGYETTKEDLFQTFEEGFNIVWRGEPDSHRWYTSYDVVYEVEIDGVSRYFESYEMRADGDNSREDCGFVIPDLDDITEVYPKKVTTTVYVTKDKL